MTCGIDLSMQSIVVGRGEFFALPCPSGYGKSMLLGLIAGFARSAG